MTALDTGRPGAADDAIDGVTPAVVVEPVTGEEFAAALAEAARQGQATVIRGGGTKLGWGRPPRALGLVVSTARLDSLLVHRDGDLTVTVGAGVPLARLNATLAARGQWLPVDSAFEGATIGGMLASNDAGPLRHRHGTPRDLLIGITLALTDGRLVKAGGTVVKNVAGYDLGKLVTGSFGALAGIVDATFKLLPVPHASTTLRAVYQSPATLAQDVATLMAGQLEPLACDVRASAGPAGAQWELLVRFASSPVATAAQVEAGRGLLRGDVHAVTGADEAAVWREQLVLAWGADAVVRGSWLPANLPAVLVLLEDLARSGTPARLAARAGVGTGLVALSGDAAALARAVGRLRAAGGAVEHAVILRGSAALKAAADVWGTPPESARAAAAVKAAFDPRGILNAGRGPV